MRKYILVLLASSLFSSMLYAGNPLYRYRVSLTDKQTTAYSLAHPEQFLSPKALERRARQKLPVDSTDLPVSSVYLKQIADAGVKVVGTSRWNNTALVETDDTTRIARVRELPFVAETLKVWTSPDSRPPRDTRRKE